MKTRVSLKDVFVVVAVAVTAFLATALLLRGPDAVASKPSLGRAAGRSALKVGDVEVTLTPTKNACQPNEKPTLGLKAVNRGARAAAVKLTIDMLTQPTPRPYSRMLLMPKQAWSEPCELTLGPGQTRTLTLKPGVVLGAGHTATFVLRSGKKAVHAGAITVPGAKSMAWTPKNGGRRALALARKR